MLEPKDATLDQEIAEVEKEIEGDVGTDTGVATDDGEGLDLDPC